jgi:hypothetical protein
MRKRLHLILAALLFSVGAFAQTQMVTFQVENPSGTPVHVVGSWNGWSNWPGVAMTMVAPGKYSATISMASNATYEFLYTVDSSGTINKEILDPTWPCTNLNTQYTNRIFTLGSADTGLCYTFATCTTCTITPPPPPPVLANVTFSVQSTDSTPVYVFGNWNNWSNFPGTPMTLNATTGNYEATIAVNKNTNYEFLYVNGTGTKEVLLPAMTCTNADPVYTNRTLAIGNNDTSFCNVWATCGTCTVVPPPTPVNVTFQVDMADSTPVHMIGSWDWAIFPGLNLTQVGPNKYSGTKQLMPNQNYQFKFLQGASNTFEVLNPNMPCTNADPVYTNRTLTLGANDTALCFTFSSCATCTITPPPPPPANINVKFAVKSTDSMPVYIFGNWNNWSNFPGH